MHRPPRDPKVPITNRGAVTLWIIYGAVLSLVAFVPLAWGPDQPSPDHASASLTMTFAVMGFCTAFNALSNRRDPTSGLLPPILKALGILMVTVVMVVLGTELPGLQRALMTTSLSGLQWLASICLALVLLIVIEVSKWIRRRQAGAVVVIEARRAVSPARALVDATT